MKIKKKAAVAAAAFLTMTNFSACNNVNQDVYGPPPETHEYTETTNNDDTPQNEEETDTDNSETSEGDEQQ